MRLIVAAVGRLKDAERDLCERYAKRFDAAGARLGLGPLAICRTQRKPRGQRRRAQGRGGGAPAEGCRRRRRRASCSTKAARHCRAKRSPSGSAQTRDGGCKGLAFLIGGPDGHGPEAVQGAALKLSLGAMTLPHGLARAVLIEQLYRAATILSGHPYHRG